MQDPEPFHTDGERCDYALAAAELALDLLEYPHRRVPNGMIARMRHRLAQIRRYRAATVTDGVGTLMQHEHGTVSP